MFPERRAVDNSGAESRVAGIDTLNVPRTYNMIHDSGNFRLDVDGASTTFVHQLLRCLVQRLRVGIKDLNPMMLVNEGKAFRLSGVVLHSENHPKSVFHRNFDEVVNKTIDAVYIDLYR